MAGLKELRTRIESIKSTQKITSAMKMVAAARLRRTQDLLAKSASYHDGLEKVAAQVLSDLKEQEQRLNIRYVLPKMIMPSLQAKSYLLMAFSSDRGLCGSYNAAVIKETLRRIAELEADGKTVKVICVGKKIADALKHRCPENVLETYTGIAGKGIKYSEMTQIVEPVLGKFEAGEFDVCEFVYAKFRSAISRDIVCQQFLPFAIDVEALPTHEKRGDYFYDAPLQKVLADVLPMILLSTAFQVLVNSQASEHGARMTSMDNATRNAKDMISKLTLKYNRIRQTAITTELVEIIAGAEAL